MKSVVIIFYIVTVWITLTHEVSPSHNHDNVAQRIINGQEAVLGQFPWQAAILVNTSDGRYLCGGALINDKWIVTAAHCIYEARSMTISLGSNSLYEDDPNRMTFVPKEGYVHDDFEAEMLSNDIGLVAIPSPINFTDTIKPIDLPTSSLVEGTTVTVSGWGLTGESDSASENLNYVDLVIISDTECWSSFGAKGSGVVCAQGRDKQIIGTCEGDSGGPLVVNGTQNPVLVGLASFSNRSGCKSADARGFTRLFYYKDWIRNVITSS